MKHTSTLIFVVAAALATALAACAPSAKPPAEARDVASLGASATAAAPDAAMQAPPGVPDPASPAALPLVVVHKSPSCGCCGAWVEHMREAGFAVEVRNEDNLEPVKSRLGVPLAKGSCHTAEVGGYFVEGHVPAEDVKRLLAQAPDARGLVLPGMPIGSPGMESPDGRVQPYTVELVTPEGSTRIFAQHGDQPE